MLTRREAIGSILYPAGAAMIGASLVPGRIASAVAAANAAAHPDDPAELVARNEDFWRPIQQAFTVDRSLINLNNGGVSPSPAIVQEAMKRHLDFCNATPPSIALWETLKPRRETVRQRLADHWGVAAEELAITRNATESLMVCQLGLNLAHGDEVLTTCQDYPRMLAAFRQRQRREGIVLKTVSIPVPCEDPALIVSLFERSISSRTRLILVCHMINLTGQILPVQEIVSMARRRGIPVIVDGAHALAHINFKLSDLDCDYYGVSLHKWLFAPHGTGLLYVRRDKIKSLWPLFAADEKLDADIRKFEEIGTHPAANSLAIAEALTFHQGIGDARKEARLRHLRDLWAKRLLAFSGRVKLHTSLKPEFSCGIGTFQIDGIDSERLVDHLKNRRQILTTLIKHDEFQGVRVTPSVYTTLEELERFCEEVEEVIRSGLREGMEAR